MLWVYGHYTFFLIFQYGAFRRQILPSKDGPHAERVNSQRMIPAASSDKFSTNLTITIS